MMRLVLLSGSSGSLSLDSTWSVDWGLLNWALGAADGRGAGNSGGAEITTVVALGGGVGNGLVGPERIPSVFWFPPLVCMRHSSSGFHSLANGLVAVEGGLVEGGWLLDGAGLLGDQGNTTLLSLSWLNTNGLGVDKTGVLAGVEVDQVHWVAGELDTTTLDKVGVLGACRHENQPRVPQL